MISLIGATVSLVAAAPCRVAEASQSRRDLWDISQGIDVTSHSGTLESFPVTNMFGGTGPTGTTGALFRDDQLSGFVHFVQWRTPDPMLLERFDLYATHDGSPFDANERGFSRFSLLARRGATEDFEKVFDFFPTNPYTIIGDEGLLLSQTVRPLVAQEFRAEFVQFGDRTPSARGPRVRELDGFGTVVPDPSGCALLIAGIGAVATGRGRASRSSWRRAPTSRPAPTRSDCT